MIFFFITKFIKYLLILGFNLEHYRRLIENDNNKFKK